jgi:Fur family transcriptional regulator, iron response regulator
VTDLGAVLRTKGIQPTPQRLAVARFVLGTSTHPTADEVWERARRKYPTLSRATVYNTLNLLVDEGLLKARVITEGAVVFDPHVGRHHHFVDEATGQIHDIPWGAIRVSGESALRGFEVREYQVVMKGRRRPAWRPRHISRKPGGDDEREQADRSEVPVQSRRRQRHVEP